MTYYLKLFLHFLFENKFITKSSNKNKITIDIEINNIFPTEFPANLQRTNIMVQEIRFPIRIAIIESLIFKFVNPAITLLDHTPVKGKGRAEKPQSAKHFWSGLYLSNLLALALYLLVNLFAINPVVLYFNFLIKKITIKQGIELPKKEIRKAETGETVLPAQIALFNANGIAILLSNKGQIATNNIASQTHEEKV